MTALYFLGKREYTFSGKYQREVVTMELFRPAGPLEAAPHSRDWTREHGYAQVSRFDFPDLYLDDKVARLVREEAELAPFLQRCLENFVNHEYGHLSSLDLVENFLRATIPAPSGERSGWRSSMTWACSTWRKWPPGRWPWSR